MGEKKKQKKFEGNGIKLEDLWDDNYVVLFEIIHFIHRLYKCLLFDTSSLLDTVGLWVYKDTQVQRLLFSWEWRTWETYEQLGIK